MARTVRHFSLHRITGPALSGAEVTELRVVADVEAGVLPVVQVEESVIRGYVEQGGWPHRFVTLFILQDLQPLVRQLAPTPSLLLIGGGIEGGGPALNYRPVVNVYDLADQEGCHVFVNRQAMVKEGYWDDHLAIQGLLAHEHAHPLAENQTTSASRRLRVELSLVGAPPAAEIRDSRFEIRNLLRVLAVKLCCYAPREIFANQLTITRGFGEALLHLDRLNVANASRGVAGRDELRRQLQQEVTHGNLTPAGAGLLLLIGDLRAHLDLALEVAPFYRTGRESDARNLEAVLETTVFPHVEPQVARAYNALRDQYVELADDLSPSQMVAWGERVLDTLTTAVAEKGLTLQYRLQIADGGHT